MVNPDFNLDRSRHGNTLKAIFRVILRACDT